MSMKRHTAEILLLVITILWGGTFAVVKTAVADVDPSMFVLLRFSIALVVSVAFWSKSIRYIDGEILGKGLFLGVLFGVGFMLQTVGLTETTASTSAFITGSMVVFVPIAHRIIAKAPLRIEHLTAIIIVLVGLWMFTSPESNGVNIGDVLTMGSSIVWSIYLTYIDIWTTKIRDDPQKQNALVILQFVSTVIIAGAGVAFQSYHGVSTTVSFSTEFILGILYCSIAASVIPTFIQTRYQQFTHPVRAGVIFAVEPVAASIIAWILINEEFSARQLVGGAVILAGIVVPDLLKSAKRS